MNQKLSSNSISMVFFLKKTKLLKNGEASICMRITVNSQRTEVMIKRSIAPEKWNQVKECAMGNDHASRELNHFIEMYKTKVYQIFRQMEMDNRTITARQITDILLHHRRKKRAVISPYDSFKYFVARFRYCRKKHSEFTANACA